MRERVTIFVMGLLILVTACTASAQRLLAPGPEARLINPAELQGELDQYSDSLWQFTLGGALFWNGSGMYAKAKFLAPADFGIRGTSMIIYDPVPQLSTLNTYFYSVAVGGGIGTLLGSITAVPVEVPWNPPYYYARLEFTDPLFTVDIASGVEFWVVVGPIPNYQQNNQWTLPVDDDGDISYTDYWGFSVTSLQYPAQGDWYFYVVGNIEDFSNVRAAGLTNQYETFHLRPNTNLLFTGYFDNTGNMPSAAGQAVFSLKNSLGVEVFTQTVALPSVVPGDTVEVSTTVPVTPGVTDRFIASVTAVVAGDGDNNDDNFKLLQNSIDENGWYRYDDGSTEGSIGYEAASGPGSVLYPIEYPARLDSVRLYYSEAHAGEIVNVFQLDPDAHTYQDLWTGTFDMVQGWNSIAINDETVNIDLGGFAIGYQIAGDFNIPQDSNQPVSAANAFMSPASFTYYAGTFQFFTSTSGNWMVQGKITSAAPPDIQIVFPPLSTDMGETPVGVPLITMLTFGNLGADDGHITNIVNSFPTLVIPAINDLPVTIPAGGEYDLEVIWTPTQEGPVQMGFQVMHDDPDDQNPYVIGLTGNATADVAYSDPAVPAEYFLDQNRPNPFNPETTIKFGLKAPGLATVKVVNVMGQEVSTLVSQNLSAGTHTVQFNASDLPSGVYFYTLEVNGYQSIQKMVLMK